MLHIVLVEPEIPANTGNIARTCAVTGCCLHLIRPLGFDISDKALKRAGLDYWHLVDVRVYDNLDDFFQKNRIPEMWCLSTKAPAPIPRRNFMMAPISSSARKPRACLRISWLNTGTAACAFPCGLKHGA